jgi:hypothetical protein
MWDDLAGEVVQQLAAAWLRIGASGHGSDDCIDARGELGPQLGVVLFGRLCDAVRPTLAHDRFSYFPSDWCEYTRRPQTQEPGSRSAVSTVDVVKTSGPRVSYPA